MPTPTDIRAALRDAANALARIGLRRDAELIASLRAIADAPPTVAELLPRVDATHEVHWVSTEGGRTFRAAFEPMRAHIIFEGKRPDGSWFRSQLCPHDLGDEAHVVEVGP